MEIHCEVCDKTFKYKRNYKAHKKVHNGIRHKCDICPKDFADSRTLQTHIQTIHENLKMTQKTLPFKYVVHSYFKTIHKMTQNCYKKFDQK